MAKRKMKYSWKKKYKVISEKIGEGGNGTVSLVKSIETGKIFALKCLKDFTNTEKKGRFIDEITVMTSNADNIDGIMPIYEYSTDEFWYIMPVAKPVIKYIADEKMGFNKVLALSISFARVIKDMHSNEIVHRDIKPLNMYFLDGKAILGDFGLVDFPENANEFTRSNKGLGAIFTIAPEMKRNPKDADGKKADVFSFAKTVWMFFTLNEKGFDGQYLVNDPEVSLRYIDKYKNIHLVEFELLLEEATDTNPDKRPSMEEMYSRLLDYQNILNNFDWSQKSDWNNLSQSLFGKFQPKSVRWDRLGCIIDVLNTIGKVPAYNHMLFSDYGGLDFDHAEMANEPRWIYIYDTMGYCRLVKPKCLYFEDFGDNFTWNYFLLELEQTEAVDCIADTSEYEVLVEDYPGNYVSARYSQYGVYDYDSGKKLPDGYKVVYRYFRGKILIVFKCGLYNSIAGTYDGRHGDCSNAKFREYIEQMIRCEKFALEKNIAPQRMLDKVFQNNPFISAEDDEVKIEREKESNPDDVKAFIEKNIFEWVMEVPTFENNKEEYLVFSFSIKADTHSVLNLFDKKWILTKQGKCIKEPAEESQIYYVYSREMALKLRTALEQYIADRIAEAGLIKPYCDSYVSIEMKMNKKPTQLFSYEEMIAKMRSADDRYDNTVVIDGTGEIQIIRDLVHRDLYPVTNGEAWIAGNIYVGKYAKLDDEKDLYMNLLQKWCDYLTTGTHQFIDCYENILRNEEDLIEEIKNKSDI